MGKFQHLADSTREATFPEELIPKVVQELASQGYEATVYHVEGKNGHDVLRILGSSVITPEEQDLYRLPAGENFLGGKRLFLSEPHYDSGSLVLPLEYKGKKAILHIQGVREEEVEDFVGIKSDLAVSFYNAFAREQDRYKMEHDLPTGLFNKQYFLDRLNEAFEVSAREGTPFAVMIFDIDRFKALNTRHGHPKVDRCILKPYAEMLKENVSSSKREKRPVADVLARYGGEEFAWSGFTDLNGAYVVAERFRSQTEKASFYVPNGGEDGGYARFTVSTGIATYPSDAKDPIDLLDKADVALNYAKKHGRRSVYAFVDGKNRKSPLNPSARANRI